MSIKGIDANVLLVQLPEAERRGIPHHMIDVAMPGDDFSAGSFFDMARSITTDILQVGELMSATPHDACRPQGQHTLAGKREWRWCLCREVTRRSWWVALAST